jgi:polyhydroxyalkanoate synthesis regulator phasin
VIHKILTLISAISIITALPVIAGGDENYLSHRLSAVILVSDAEKASDLLTTWAENAGGYYIFKSRERVTLRIPYQKIADLRSYLDDVSEEVVKIDLQARDLREDILQARSGLSAREEILEQNLKYIDKTDAKGTLAIEKEILRLISEIEGLKGRLRKLENDRMFALGEIQLSFQGQTLPQDIPSSFDWINSVDFYRFMGETF